jgi:uncharacterized protein YggL (DUF469 family)
MSAACPSLGFVSEFQLRSELTAPAAKALWNAFIRDLIEERGLACHGGHYGGRWLQIVHGEAGQATAADREAVLVWARGRPEIVMAEAGSLIDLDDG